MTILQTTTVVEPMPLLVLGTLICFIVAFVIGVSNIDADVAGWIAIISFLVGLILRVLSFTIVDESTR